MMTFMNDFAQNFQTSFKEASSLRRPGSSSASQNRPASSTSYKAAQGTLTTHVWPKSRMLLAIVSKMSKEGVLDCEQRGILKDLILDYDPRVMRCLQEYETGGNRDKLYENLLSLSLS